MQEIFSDRYRALLAAFALMGVALATPAEAVLIANGDGNGNAGIPDPDPGVRYVGRRLAGGRSAVYLGDGWVLSARHVGAGDVEFEGARYEVAPDSAVEFTNHDGSLTDLVLFRLVSGPDLPMLGISEQTPTTGTPVWMAGYGFSRGRAIEWRHSRAHPAIGGWRWGRRLVRRWGTNTVSEVGEFVEIDETSTRSFAMQFNDPFDPAATEYEAVAAVGDSGGGIFVQNDGGFELAGILFAVTNHPDQPEKTALFGNFAMAVDLATYRRQIRASMAAALGPTVESSGDSGASRSLGSSPPAPWECGLGFEIVFPLTLAWLIVWKRRP